MFLDTENVQSKAGASFSALKSSFIMYKYTPSSCTKTVLQGSFLTARRQILGSWVVTQRGLPTRLPGNTSCVMFTLMCAHWSETTGLVKDHWQTSHQNVKQLDTTKHNILRVEVVCCEAKECEGGEQHIQAPILCSMLSFSWLLRYFNGSSMLWNFKAAFPLILYHVSLFKIWYKANSFYVILHSYLLTKEQ